MVTISGKITFDRIPFKTTVGQGLNFASPVESPARSVVVEALDGSSSTVLASTSTNATGDYSVQVPAARSVRIRAKAQMLSDAVMNFRVLNNNNSDALYVLDGAASSSGASNSTRNLRAASGWGGTSYTATRAAAPFAILDTVYRAKELVVGGAANTSFPALNLYWSENNKDASGCTDDGNIGTSFYTEGQTNAGNCTSGGALKAGIYILGFVGGGIGDTDEFDQHVIAHEFGHYIESQFGRSDSIGGIHSGDDRLDLRVAFGEGWGNAYSGMALNDPVYRDSSGTTSTSDGFLNLESDSANAEGWFSEASVGEIVWDVFDSVADAGDNVALGFAPIFSVMTSNSQRNTDAFTSIYSFAVALRAANPASSAAIGALLTGESISGTDAFATSESNDGGNTRVLPVYTDIALNTQRQVCSTNQFGSIMGQDPDLEIANKLGNRVFLRFVNDSTRLVTFTAIAAVAGPGTTAATDPDMLIWRRGTVLSSLQGDDETDANETAGPTSLDPGTYIIDAYDYQLTGTNTSPRCMTVSVTGN